MLQVITLTQSKTDRRLLNAGEALCRLATKSVSLGPLMECIALDSQKVQLPEHRAWLREKGEALFGCPMEQVCSVGTVPFCCTALQNHHCRRLMHARHWLVATTLNAEVMRHVCGDPEERICLASCITESIQIAGREHCAVL